MKNKTNLFILAIISVFISSCQLGPCYNKSSFMDNLSDLVEESKDNKREWTDNQWEELDHKLEELMDNCYEKFKGDLTREEKKQIAKDATTYVYNRQKEKFADLYSVLDEVDLADEAKKILSVADDQIKEIFNDVLKDDLINIIDDVVNEIEGLSKELKEAWEEAKEN